MTESLGKGRRRNEILVAARNCLALYGFEKMTMDDVGNEVGLNKASLYYYYRNKEALVADVLTSEAKLFIQSLREKVESVEGCRERIQTYLVERFRISQKVMNLHNMSRGSFRRIRPLFRELHQKFKDEEVSFISRILLQCRDGEEIGDCDEQRVARAIMTIVEAYKSQAIEEPGISAESPVDYSSIEDELLFTVSLVLEGLARSTNNN